MKLDHIHYILEIDRQGSLNRAAAALFISQPYLSNMVRKLEDELGFKLFIRTPRGMIPTSAGREVLEYAQKVEFYVKKIQNLSPQNMRSSGESFSIGSISSSVIFDLWHQYQDALGGSSVHSSYIELPDNEVAQAVNLGAVDIGFLYYQDYREREFMQDLEMKGLVFQKLIQEPFCVLLHPENELYSRSEVTIQDMNQYSFICETDESHILMHKKFFPSWFNNGRLAAVKFGTNRGGMCYLADHPDCFFMGQYALNHSNPLVTANQFRYVPLSDSPYLLITGYAMKKGTELTAAKKGFLTYVTDHFARETGPGKKQEGT